MSSPLPLPTLRLHSVAYRFKRPVTVSAAPNYGNIVQRPMDLSAMQRQLDDGGGSREGSSLHHYDAAALLADLVLLAENAVRFYGKVGNDGPAAAAETLLEFGYVVARPLLCAPAVTRGEQPQSCAPLC